MLTELLTDAGYGVIEAQTGVEALSRLREHQPDLIVLDLMLPGMSGWEFLKHSRDLLDRLNLPVMIVSAIAGKSDYPSTLGVAAWLTKPLDIPRFLSAVEQLADTSHRNGKRQDVEHTPPARVLIVEDEPVIRDLLREQLAIEGYIPELAGSIAEARRHIDAGRPDLILLDLMLPVEDGWTFLRSRRADAALSGIPVIAISAAPHERLLEAKELGADAFLSKPFDVDALIALTRSFAG
jgi:CheY-like chemotaxis protein